MDIDKNELGHNAKENLSVKMNVTEFVDKILGDIDIQGKKEDKLSQSDAPPPMGNTSHIIFWKRNNNLKKR